MKLMVVESPNKIKKLEAILGRDWKVMASVGHIRDLPRKEFGIEQKTFALTYEFIPPATFQGRTFPGGEERIARIKKELRNAQMVYLATDPDREGEAIAWHLKEALGLKENHYVRVSFDAITEKVISTALSKARKIDNDLVHAQEARRALDRMVGYLVSPLLSAKLGMSLSTGRVQSPALRLVVDQERRIKAFKKTSHFGAIVSFDKDQWQAEWDTKPFVGEDAPYVLDEYLALRAANSRQFRITHSDSGTLRQAPPSPFSTSLLLQAASVALKLDPEHTAKLAQKLFEQGAITYMRTDSVNFSEEAIAEIRDFAALKKWPLPDRPRRFKSKAEAQEAHEAIRPTHIDVEQAGEDDQQQALYQLIWQRSVASQLADATYKINSLSLEATDTPEKFPFKAKGRTLIEPGWRILTAKDAVQEEGAAEDANSGTVPLLAIGSTKQADSGKVQRKETKPPPRFTKASLIAKLETQGIGRPSTYPAIMHNITSKGYLTEVKRNLEPTEIGQALIDRLVQAQFAFVELAFTRDLEKELDQIAEGKSTYLTVVTSAFEQLQADIAAAGEQGTIDQRFACPTCKTGALRRYQKKNKTSGKPNGDFGWFCTSDSCKTFLDDENGRPIAMRTEPCPICNKPMYRHPNRYGYWWGCSGFKQGCKTIMDDKDGNPVRRISRQANRK